MSIATKHKQKMRGLTIPFLTVFSHLVNSGAKLMDRALRKPLRSKNVRGLSYLFVFFCYSVSVLSEEHHTLSEKIKIANPTSIITQFPEDSAHPYFAIQLASLQPLTQGTAVIFHGQGEHADSPGIIHSLRTQLPLYGWDTLSIQRPDSTRDIETYIRQLNPFLLSQKLKTVVLIAHGPETQHIINTLPIDSFENILAVVIISLAAGDEDQTQLINAITRFNSPILDIYGQFDYPHIKSSATRRLAIITQQRKQNDEPEAKLQQLIIPAANHTFTGQTHLLVKRIAGWLKIITQQAEKQ